MIDRRGFFARLAALAGGAAVWAGWRGWERERIVWPTKWPMDIADLEDLPLNERVRLEVRRSDGTWVRMSDLSSISWTRDF